MLSVPPPVRLCSSTVVLSGPISATSRSPWKVWVMPTLTLTLVMVIELGTLIVLVTPVVLLSGIATAGEAGKVRTWLPPEVQLVVTKAEQVPLQESVPPVKPRLTQVWPPRSVPSQTSVPSFRLLPQTAPVVPKSTTAKPRFSFWALVAEPGKNCRVSHQAR